MGFSTETFRAFQIDDAERERRYVDGLAALRRVLSGVALTDNGSTLYPPAAGLADRIWQATANLDTTVAAAAAGDALQLHRGVPNADSGVVQAQQAQLYLDNFRHPWKSPRIGISRAVVPAASKVAALEAIGDSLRASAARLGKTDAPTTLTEVATWADRINTKYGTPDEIADQLHADPAVQLSTDLIIGFTPLVPATDHAFRLLEIVTAELAPALGWSPAGALV
jgi:hypothetical protein